MQRASSTLVLAISSSQLYLVTSCVNAKQAWDELRAHYEQESLASKLYFKKQYFRSEMKEGSSVEEHLKHMKELTDQLTAVGAPISEEDQVVTLLGSLPKSYNTLVTALEARTDQPRLSYVQQALIREEMKLKVLGSGSANPRAQFTCSKRKPTKKQSYEQQSQRIKCYNCREFGHYARNCPKRSVRAEKSHDNHANTAEEENEEVEVQIIDNVFAAGPRCSPSDKWFIDSGASSHMTWKGELLSNYEEFDVPEKVRLGDGRTVEAYRVVTIQMDMTFKVNESKCCKLENVLYVLKLATNLFSVRAATSKGSSVKFGPSKCWIMNRNGQLCGSGKLVGKLYEHKLFTHM